MKKQIVEKIILSVLNQKPIKIKEVIGKGEVNKIFVVSLKNKKVLLRISLKEEGLTEFEKEEWCIKKAKQKGVFGPNILKIGKYEGISYMIYEFIEGKSDKEVQNKNKTWQELGKYAKLINSIKVNGYGLKFSPRQKKFLESWSKYINYNINSLNEKDNLLQLNIYKKPQLSIIKKYFLDLKNKKFKIGLAHNDLSLRNVIVNKSGKVFLIDWGCAEANIVPHSEFVEVLGAGHLDLGKPTNEEMNNFLKGYRISKKQFEDLKKEISKFLLLVSFDKVRWAIDRSPKDIKQLSSVAKKRLNYALKVNS